MNEVEKYVIKVLIFPITFFVGMFLFHWITKDPITKKDIRVYLCVCFVYLLLYLSEHHL